MILGADNQNKNLRAAAKIKSNPTEKARTGNHYSAAISTSKTGGGTKSTVSHQSKTGLNDGSPDPMRGSFEGLDTGKSAHIQQNGRGYTNQSLQGARYASKDKTITPAGSSSLSFTNKGFKGIMDNYSGVTMSGTSSNRLGKSLRLNGMF
jgi:hypothetical protein